uniref:Uncharacterized protein n=1 Tax=Caenorhabditis japonica TaxID=281687 RepID=A0A8R1DH08_CAEJA
MNCRLFFLTTVLLGPISASPLILHLKDYKNGTIYNVAGVEDGANLYLASNDNSDHFRNIQITTGGANHSLTDLTGINSDGTPKKLSVSGGLSISTTNENSITNELTGYIYVTTVQQAQDPLFSVYVITGTHNITINGVQTTTVILNTEFRSSSGDADQPEKNTYVKDILQNSDSNIYFQWGIPSDTYKSDTKNKFFENPINLPNKDNTAVARHFFDHIEPLQIGLDYWYFTTDGSVTMTLQNTYVESHNYNTTAANTTGLVINNNFIFNKRDINFESDPTRAQIVGNLISTIIPRQKQVNFIFSNDEGNTIWQSYDNTKNQTQNLMFEEFPAQKFTINATQIIPGIFYCQYFSFYSNSLPSTNSTVTSAPTTTPGASPVTQTSNQVSSQTTRAPLTSIAPVTGSTAPVTGSTANRGTAQTQTDGSASSISTSTISTTTNISRSPIVDFLMMIALMTVVVF